MFSDEGPNDSKNATKSYSGKILEDKLLIPRRVCARGSIAKTAMADLGKFLIQAIEEDKKTAMDPKDFDYITVSDESDSSENEENRELTPINLSVKKNFQNRSQDDSALDLRNNKPDVNLRNYTLPEGRRLTPLRNTPVLKSRTNTVEIIAKKTLLYPNEMIAEGEIRSSKHVRFELEKPSQVKPQNTMDSGVYLEHSEKKAIQIPSEIDGNVFNVPEVPAKYNKSHSKEILVNGKRYQVLALLGKGGSSKVYLVLGKNNSLLAVKCVNLGEVDEKTKMDYLNEIEHLMKMQHCKHIIKIIDHQYVQSKNLLYAVMEKGDTDLSKLLKERTNSGEKIPPEMILFYWSEMLQAVKSIHDNNIIHRDLKPANFLLVSGRLKLIDFGIASSIQSEQTSVFKDSAIGTPNYMSPEAWEYLELVGNERTVRIGRKTDVWSLGCILYSFLYGKTPFQEYLNTLSKSRAITNPKHVIEFPPVPGVPDMLIECCRRCLIYDRKKRASIDELISLKNQILCPIIK